MCDEAAERRPCDEAVERLGAFFICG